MRPVERIEMTQTFRSRRDLEEGLVEITTGADVFVWFNATDALHAEYVIVFELQSSVDGRYLIRSARERELLVRGEGPSVEAASWGSIKGLYRLP